MTDTLTLTGLIASPVRHVLAADGSLPITSFRLASTHRRFDKSADKWVDAETNWYTVTAFRRLAVNAAASLVKGQRVVVSGKLKMREWEKEGRTGMNVEVVADALGHDLTWGTASFTRVQVGGAVEDGAPAAAPPDPDGVDEFPPVSAALDVPF
jgi:single-strand DNA-binding protein